MSFRLNLALLAWSLISATVSLADHVSIQPGVYWDETGERSVEVEADVPGYSYINFGPPIYYGFYFNHYTQQAAHNRQGAFSMIGDTPSLISTDPSNLYQSNHRDLGDAWEYNFSDGSDWSIRNKRFRMVVDKQSGQLREMEFHESWARKSWSWWPTVGNVILFKLRLHTGPWRRAENARHYLCRNLLLGKSEET